MTEKRLVSKNMVVCMNGVYWIEVPLFALYKHLSNVSSFQEKKKKEEEEKKKDDHPKAGEENSEDEEKRK